MFGSEVEAIQFSILSSCSVFLYADNILEDVWESVGDKGADGGDGNRGRSGGEDDEDDDEEGDEWVQVTII